LIELEAAQEVAFRRSKTLEQLNYKFAGAAAPAAQG
jgi:hypothetical protein